MLNAEERSRLMSRLGRDSISPLAAVLKCFAALLVLVIIAAGPWTFLTAGGPPGAEAERVSPQGAPAVAESRRVFEERRQAYDSARESRAVSPKNATTGPWLGVAPGRGKDETSRSLPVRHAGSVEQP